MPPQTQPGLGSPLLWKRKGASLGSSGTVGGGGGRQRYGSSEARVVDVRKKHGWLGALAPGIIGGTAKRVLETFTGNKSFVVVGGEDAGPSALAAIKEAERLNAIQDKIEKGYGPAVLSPSLSPVGQAGGVGQGFSQNRFQGDKSFLEGRVGSTVSAPAKKSTRAFIPGKRTDLGGADAAGTK